VWSLDKIRNQFPFVKLYNFWKRKKFVRKWKKKLDLALQMPFRIYISQFLENRLISTATVRKALK